MWQEALRENGSWLKASGEGFAFRTWSLSVADEHDYNVMSG